MATLKTKIMHELDEKIVTVATGLFGAVAAATGIVWHGLFGQPSMMNLMYPGFWGSGMNYLIAIIGGFILGAFYGWLFAVVYNWTLKNMR